MKLRPMLGVGLMLGAGIVSAQAPAEERIRVEDPKDLRALGLRPDASNVYRWSKAVTDRGWSTEAAANAAPESWGSAPGYTTVMGYELAAAYSAANDNIYLRREAEKTYCREVSGVFPVMEALAPVEVPDGAALSDFKYWAYDEEASYGLTFNLLETCTTNDGFPPTTMILTSADTFGSAGYYFGFKPLNNYVVHRDRCSLSVHVLFSEPDVTCHSDRLQVQKIQVSWVRQVSPAPASATFNDVPTGHPFFQFIEALAKSGITGGCGSGNYCPDQPLTRGQMAVFLSKGLGLSWP